MLTLNPYLNFNGNTEEAFNFYQSVFGGEFIGGISRFKDSPEGEHMPVPEKDLDKIMHIALPIGKGNMLMATDALESMGQKLTVGDNFSLSLNVDSEAEADKLFSALSAGGKPTMPMGQTSWGYFGMCTDKFGIQWMVNYDNQQQ
ncbi:VOC family protein [Catalinimonas niigatensis]|uniref:VOC family protein n=1 Tax=Catalinimonas niigatensis TaxID=1397264 RepID=UPI0026653DF3|nr:VOC family protein [Catalinimonas niigatensis]WPP53029.1 VOC family protein [Catalinimonas niigatensis]